MHSLLRDILIVGAGGFLGSACRFLLATAFMNAGIPGAFPVGTFAVNAIGSLLIGVLIPLTDGAGPLNLLLTVGFCGGFTTFSTFSAETLSLLRERHIWTGLGYAAASVLVCLLFVGTGIFAGSKIKGI